LYLSDPSTPAAEKELETFLEKPLGQQFFRRYLQTVFADHLYEFCEEVHQRKDKSKARREALGMYKEGRKGRGRGGGRGRGRGRGRKEED
jgi:hypothetical protein